MKRTIFLLTGLMMTLCAMGAARPIAQEQDPGGHCAWLAERIKEMQAVKFGMTRREVQKLLNADINGMEHRSSVRYENPKCSYIKLNLGFKLDKGTKAEDGRDNDTVTKISEPFLDLVPN